MFAYFPTAKKRFEALIKSPVPLISDTPLILTSQDAATPVPHRTSRRYHVSAVSTVAPVAISVVAESYAANLPSLLSRTASLTAGTDESATIMISSADAGL